MYIIDKQREITQSLAQLANREELLRFLVKKGMLLAPLAPDFKNDNYLLPGCEVKIWLVGDLKLGRFIFNADAESRIVKGVVHLLLEIYQGATAQEIFESSDDFISEGKWPTLLSASRRSGISHILKTIRELARQKSLDQAVER